MQRVALRQVRLGARIYGPAAAFSTTTRAQNWLPFDTSKAPWPIGPSKLALKGDESGVKIQDTAASVHQDTAASVQEGLASPGADASAPAAESVKEAASDAVPGLAETLGTQSELALARAGQLGDLDLSVLATSWMPHPILRMEQLILSAHEHFMGLDIGIPWLALLVGMPLVARLMLFPFAVRGQRHAAHMAEKKPILLNATKELTQAKASGDQAELQLASMKLAKMMKEHDISPLKGVVFPILQGATFIVFFAAFRALANAPVPSMSHEGFMWFADLTMPDPFYVLPILNACFTYTLPQLSPETTQMMEETPAMSWIIKGVTIVSIPIIGGFSSAMVLYFMANAVFGIGQGLLFRNPAVRKYLGIKALPKRAPPPPKDPLEPPKSLLDSVVEFKDKLTEMLPGMKDKPEEQPDFARSSRRIRRRGPPGGRPFD